VKAKTTAPVKRTPRAKAPVKRTPRAKAPTVEKIDWIADQEVVWVFPNRKRVPGRVAVERPRERGTGEWVCRMDCRPLHHGVFGISGGSSWQALLLALQFVGYQVHYHVQRGGSIQWPKQRGQKRGMNYDPKLLMGALFRDVPRREA
jgi:hypothetical protein